MEQPADTDPPRLEELRRRALRYRHCLDEHAPPGPRDALRTLLYAFITEDLTVTERRIVVCHYVEGMTSQEIGATLGLPWPQVAEIHRSVVARARARVGFAGQSIERKGRDAECADRRRHSRQLARNGADHVRRRRRGH